MAVSFLFNVIYTHFTAIQPYMFDIFGNLEILSIKPQCGFGIDQMCPLHPVLKTVKCQNDFKWRKGFVEK